MALTGRKVFFITAGAFSVIIGVNLTLAWNAVATFPGLEVKNSYVASQTFDADRAAQEALGWTAEARVEGDELVLAITDAAGAPAPVAMLDAVFGRATHVAEDQAPAFVFDGQVFRAPIQAGRGNWNLRLDASAPDGTAFRQRLQVRVSS